MFDFIGTFNAIHHFDPVAFLRSANDMLRPGGYIFLYTRLQEQNEETIWGRHFPDFLKKEQRLYRMEQVQGWLCGLEDLELYQIRLLRHARTASLQRLVDLVERRHYSTFQYYPDPELRKALAVFRQ